MFPAASQCTNSNLEKDWSWCISVGRLLGKPDLITYQNQIGII
jgi:hypothetical protein